ncbi:MAG: hypothetical protein H6811_04260 [Phycisphaeraceae bacterium]|nr:hypothetical protein [Phycisphaeraceae bacterium]
MRSVMATALQTPPRLVTDAPPVGGEESRFWTVLIVFGSIAIASSLTALVLWWHRSVSRNPREHAFRSLARRLGLGRRDRALVRRLATRQSVQPVALLVSPGGLRIAIEAAVSQPTGRPDARALARLEHRLLSS